MARAKHRANSPQRSNGGPTACFDRQVVRNAGQERVNGPLLGESVVIVLGDA